jgi:phage shock protein A
VSHPDELENRVTSLEHQVARLQNQAALAVSDAGAARLLAAGADQDVSAVRSELRAHIQVLNALRETQLEQGRALTSIDQRVTGIDQRVTGIDQRVTGIDQKMTEGFATLGAGMAQITALLTRNTDSESD